MARKNNRASAGELLKHRDAVHFITAQLRIRPDALTSLRARAVEELEQQGHFSDWSERSTRVTLQTKRTWLANSGNLERMRAYHLTLSSRGVKEADRQLEEWYDAEHPARGRGRPEGYVPYETRVKIMMGLLIERAFPTYERAQRRKERAASAQQQQEDPALAA